MRTIIRIMKTELRILFYSPVAWVLLVVFLTQMGYCFADSIKMLTFSSAASYSGGNLSLRLVTGLTGVITKMMDSLYLYIPLISMGLISRELHSGTIKLLYSSPVSNTQIVLGKFMSMVVFCVLLCLILLIPIIFTIIYIDNPDIPALLTALLGVFAIILTYSSIGLFMSSLTRSQVFAAVTTFAVLGVLNKIGDFAQGVKVIEDITFWLSFRARVGSFFKGLIISKNIIYFILIISLFLGLTIIKLGNERLKLSKVKSLIRYILVVSFTVFAGYIFSLPALTFYWDATFADNNTLSQETQDILNSIEEDIEITSYVNVLDNTWNQCPRNGKNLDKTRFDNYSRYKPSMKMKYVYYYGDYKSNLYLDRQKDKFSPEEGLELLCNVYGYNPKNFKSYKEIDKEILTLCDGKFLRVIKAGDKTTYIRTYNDDKRHPEEREYAAAFKRLVVDSPVVAFLTGHDENSVVNYGDSGISLFSCDTGFRNALVNQGYTAKEVDLSAPISNDIDVLVITNMKESLTREEEQNFDEYLARGGDMLILGEARRQEFMNPLLSKLGLKLSDNIIVAPSAAYSDDILSANYHSESIKANPNLRGYYYGRTRVVTPSTLAVDSVDNKGFDMFKILVSPTNGSWIENETTDFLNEKSTLNTSKGEVEKSNTIMAYLTRNVDGKKQKIYVGGDSDMILNSNIAKNWTGLGNYNFGLVQEIFRDFANNNYPVTLSKREPKDISANVTKEDLKWTNALFIWILPSLFTLLSLFLLLQRRRK